MSTVPDLRAFEFLDHIVHYCEKQFPRQCASCGLGFDSFAQFVSATLPIGEPQVYDSLQDMLDELGDPIGALSLVNCPCGTTMAVKCGDTSSDMYVQLLAALQGDVEATGLKASGVLEVLRREIRSRLI